MFKTYTIFWTFAREHDPIHKRLYCILVLLELVQFWQYIYICMLISCRSMSLDVKSTVNISFSLFFRVLFCWFCYWNFCHPIQRVKYTENGIEETQINEEYISKWEKSTILRRCIYLHVYSFDILTFFCRIVAISWAVKLSFRCHVSVFGRSSHENDGSRFGEGLDLEKTTFWSAII